MTIRRKVGLLFFIVLLPILFTVGCFFGDKVILPVKTNNVANTFKLSEENWGGTLIGVKVFDSTYTEILWHIEAIREIPVKGFEVTVGDIPIGFKQTVPSSEIQYIPNSGIEYVIVVEANFKPPAWGFRESWIAD
jgi:hypothetical protein